jgi:hypothetical protein
MHSHILRAWCRAWRLLPAEAGRVVLAFLAGGLVAAIGWELAGWWDAHQRAGSNSSSV